MANWSQIDIEELLEGFQGRNLDEQSWTHDAHLIVACYFLRHFPPNEALIYLRSGIISLNVSMGVENTPKRGYHETLTCFYHWVIKEYVATQDPDGMFWELCNRFLQSPCADKRLPLAFYSKDYLFTTEARAQFLQPDRQALETKFLSFD